MNRILILLIFACFMSACDDSNKTKKSIREETNEQDSLKMPTELEKITAENHTSTMETVFGKPRHSIKNIGILVFDGVNELDFMGPRYVLGQAMGAKTQLISLKKGNITTVMGIEVVPNTVIDSVSQLDILVIPGGFKGTIEASYNQKLLHWIRKIDEQTLYTSSVCTGGWILGATGLLRGKKASTNWYREEEFLEKYGALPAEERYTKDGKYWTSAGVTAGMDMSLAMIKDIDGENYAQAIMLDMEYDASPPVIGGSPEKTKVDVYKMMLAMYDMGIQPAIDSLETKKQATGN